MALERRQRGDLGTLVNATTTEHEDKFGGGHGHIQSVERLVRIIRGRTTSTTGALALTLSFQHARVAFSASQGESGPVFPKRRPCVQG